MLLTVARSIFFCEDFKRFRIYELLNTADKKVIQIILWKTFKQQTSRL